MHGPRHLAAANHRSGRQRLLIVIGTFLSLVLLGSAGALGYVNFRFGQIARFDVGIDVPPASGEPRNYLLVGSDSRAGLDEDDPANAMFFDDEGTVTVDGPQRTDTIMILRVDPDSGKASLLSFPRDLWVTIGDNGDHNRINVAYTRGREVLIDTIRENFGIPIHHYVEVDLYGFLGLVDAVGGVPLYFETPVRDLDSGLSVPTAGCVELDGRQSLAFARARHLEYRDPDTGRWRTDPSADLGRISRQQEFIRRAISEAVSKGLTNPATLNELVNVAVEYVGLDPTLSVRDLLSLGRRFASFDADSLKTYSLPTTPFRSGGGAAVLDLQEREAEPILNVFRGIEPGTPTPGLVEVTVLNGTGEDGFAGDITDALDQVGFGTTEPADAEAPSAASTLYYGPGGEEEASLLARHLTSPVSFAPTDDLEDGEITLVAGADFTTVNEQPSPEKPDLPRTTTSSTEPGETTTESSTTTTTEPVGYVPNSSEAAGSCS